MLESFIYFNEEYSEEILLTPLNHPNIEYKWQKIPLEINKKRYFIDTIGDIKNIQDNKLIKEFNGIIGFIDNNDNIISTIVFHDPLTLNKEEYQTIFNALTEIRNKSPKKLEYIINLLKDNDELFSITQSFVIKSRYDAKVLLKYKISLDDLSEFKSFLESISKDVINEKYPHLRPIKNQLIR